MHVLSRRFEFQADRYATDLELELIEPLAKIHEENLSSVNPDQLWAAYHLTHPTLLERIKAIRAYQQTLASKKKQ
jgi:STE24 endopeptidase